MILICLVQGLSAWAYLVKSLCTNILRKKLCRSGSSLQHQIQFMLHLLARDQLPIARPLASPYNHTGDARGCSATLMMHCFCLRLASFNLLQPHATATALCSQPEGRGCHSFSKMIMRTNVLLSISHNIFQKICGPFYICTSPHAEISSNPSHPLRAYGAKSV